MSKKKKRSEEEKQAMANSLRELLSPDEKNMEHISATIINGNEQPIILSSNEDLTEHIINLGDGTSMKVPTKMVPYLSIALKILMTKHISEHFEGDKVKMQDFDKKVISEISDMDFFDLKGCGKAECEECNSSGSCSSGEITPGEIMGTGIPEMKDAFKKLDDIANDDTAKALRDMEPEDAKEVIDNLIECKDIAEEVMKSLDDKNISQAEQKKLREEANEKIMQHLKEVENKLSGTVADKNRVIDYQYIKNIMVKYGPQAAQEELMRLPEEKRDELLQQVLEDMKKGK